jgi:predicted small integral membrane protein
MNLRLSYQAIFIVQINNYTVKKFISLSLHTLDLVNHKGNLALLQASALLPVVCLLLATLSLSMSCFSLDADIFKASFSQNLSTLNTYFGPIDIVFYRFHYSMVHGCWFSCLTAQKYHLLRTLLRITVCSIAVFLACCFTEVFVKSPGFDLNHIVMKR